MSPKCFVKSDDRCHHLRYRIGCKSCKLHDLIGQLEEFKLVAQNHAQMTASCALQLENEKLKHEQRELIEEDRAIAEEAYESVKLCVEEYEAQVAHMQKAVSELIETNEPDVVATAFEADAVINEEAMLAVWQSATSNRQWHQWEEALSPADKAVVSPVLDRAKVKATPDCLVSMGDGLQVFLKQGKAQIRLPGGGQIDTSAAMSFGAALAHFGAPTLRAWTSTAKRAETLARMMAERKNAPVSEADELPVTKALFRPEQQWNLFHEKMYLLDVAMLADYYMYSVRLQQYEQDIKNSEGRGGNKDKGKAKAENSSAHKAEAVVAVGNNDWPVPTGPPTWTNFTNWIALCMHSQPKDSRLVLRRTLAAWAHQRHASKQRFAASAAAWTPPADFDDETSLYPKPAAFYSHNVTLLHMDAKRLGWNVTKK